MRSSTWLAGFVLLCIGTVPNVVAQAAIGALHETISDQGLRIWAFPDDGGDRFLLTVLVGVGSRDEEPSQTGIAHFLEHVLFAATGTRPKAAQDQQLRARSVAWNGTTTHECTTYFLETKPAQWRFAVEWLADHLLRPGFAAADVDAERQIVYEEVDLENPHAGEVTFEGVLYPRHALGRSVGGDHRQHHRIGIEQLRAFYTAHYRPANVAIGFAGRVPRDECTSAIRDAFAPLPVGVSVTSGTPVKPIAGTRVIGSGDSADPSGWLVAGFHVPSSDVAGLALVHVVASHLQHRFFDQVRERRQLAYAPQVKLRHYREVTRLSFHARVSSHSNLPVVLSEIDNLVDEFGALDEQSLHDAKAAPRGLLVANSLDELDDAMQLAWIIRRQGASPAALEPAIDQVTAADIAEYARKQLTSDHRFVLSNVPIGNGLRIAIAFALAALVALLVDRLTGFHGLLRLKTALARRWPRRRRAAPVHSPTPRTPTRVVSGDELAQRIQQYLDEEDREHGSR